MYEKEHCELTHISFMILDKDLDITHNLVKVKAGVKSRNASEPEKKLEITPKQEEDKKQP